MIRRAMAQQRRIIIDVLSNSKIVDSVVELCYTFTLMCKLQIACIDDEQRSNKIPGPYSSIALWILSQFDVTH